jgi:hypothetical protein
LKDRYKNLLDNLGYDTSCVGAMFFSDLIDEVYEYLMNGKSEEEVINLLPCIYLENYHFDYGVGRKTYFFEIEKFLDSKVIDKKSRIINRRFSLLSGSFSLEGLILFFSKYFYDIDNGNKKEIKTYKYVRRQI